MDDGWLLSGRAARGLYESVRELPIYDYHCHLSPREIRENRRFADIGTLWLEGDHYKWRLMRAAGLPERVITGDASPDEKFLAFASVLPLAAGSPVYHWAHLELKTYFGIREPLNAASAPAILAEANRQMKGPGFSARELMLRSNVRVVCTTDDPADSLEHHRALAAEGFSVRVCPTFRPDRAVCGLSRPDFSEYVRTVTGTMSGAVDFDEWLAALTKKLDFFCETGCRVSDLSLTRLPRTAGTKDAARAAFDRAMTGRFDPADDDGYTDYLFRFMAEAYRERGVVMQLHLAALRNNSARLFAAKGPDTGNDSVASPARVEDFARMLNGVEQSGGLPKTIVYTLNPASYYELATMIGNFQGEGGGNGNLLLGAAWWFCDHADGIREQLRLTAATGLLGRFTGMLTDSRSFTSYARHDYFRRLLCDYVGGMVDRGEYDGAAAEALVRGVSYDNALHYFGIKPVKEAAL